MLLNVPPIGRDVLNEPQSMQNGKFGYFLTLTFRLTRMRSAGPSLQLLINSTLICMAKCSGEIASRPCP